MQKLKVIMTIGLPGSGKTTWAKEFVKNNPSYKRINKDDLRSLLDGEDNFTKENEKFVIKTEEQLIRLCLSENKNVILDNTHLVNKHKNRIQELISAYKKGKNLSIELEIKSFIETPLEICIQRDLIRPNSLGAEKITDMWFKYRKDNGLVPNIDYQTWMAVNPDLPTCVISDIDGTLALRGDRGIYEFEKANLDKVSEPVRDLVNNQKKNGDTVVIMSAREDKFQAITEQWLKDNGVQYDHIYMRPTGDMREDSKIKEDLYNRWILNRYNVRWVVDDRNRVCGLWRKLSLLCLQVAEGNY